MRRRLLAGAALALLAWPATGHAQSGGATAPGSVPGETGGAGYGTALPRLIASRFAVAPRTLKAGAPARFHYRIDGPQPRARVRIELVKAGARRPAARLRLGWRRTGRTLTRTWTPRLAPGSYVARVQASDRSGRRLSRTATASGRSRLTILPPPKPAPTATPAPAAPPAGAVGRGVFPIRGPVTWGEPFGAARGAGRHRGQDLAAAEGLPVVAPRAGTVSWRAYQAEGAGNYLVLRADDGRDFVFMHMQTGSVTVVKGSVVAAGQAIGRVGSTGRSTGPHLHFEIWPGGWFSSAASQPVDPAPDLRAWAAGG